MFIADEFSHEIKEVALGLVASFFIGYLEFKLPGTKMKTISQYALSI